MYGPWGVSLGSLSEGRNVSDVASYAPDIHVHYRYNRGNQTLVFEPRLASNSNPVADAITRLLNAVIEARETVPLPSGLDFKRIQVTKPDERLPENERQIASTLAVSGEKITWKE